MREVQFMAVSLFERRKLAGIAAAGFILAVSGCQSGDTLGALNLGGRANAQPAAAPNTRVTQQELLAYCPSVALRSDGAVHTTYQRNAVDDPSAVIYQASISDTTRSCTYQGGIMSMTIAVAGRVVPGPQGSAGQVNLPLRVTVFRDTEQIQSDVKMHQVNVTDIAGATQFVFNDSSISMPNPTGRNIRVLVGFDETSNARR